MMKKKLTQKKSIHNGTNSAIHTSQPLPAIPCLHPPTRETDRPSATAALGREPATADLATDPTADPAEGTVAACAPPVTANRLHAEVTDAAAAAVTAAAPPAGTSIRALLRSIFLELGREGIMSLCGEVACIGGKGGMRGYGPSTAGGSSTADGPQTGKEGIL